MTRNRLYIVCTFRKRGYKPFSKTMKHDLPKSFTFGGEIIQVEKYNDLMEKIGKEYMEQSRNDGIALRVVIKVQFNQYKITLFGKTFDRSVS